MLEVSLGVAVAFRHPEVDHEDEVFQNVEANAEVRLDKERNKLNVKSIKILRVCHRFDVAMDEISGFKSFKPLENLVGDLKC